MSQALFLLFYFMLFYNCIVPLGLFPREIQVAVPVESQLPRSRAAHATVHAWRSSVFVTHRTLTWFTRSLTCAQMLMHAIAHGVYGHTWESLHWKLTLAVKSLTAQGNRTCVSGMTVRCSTNELQPHDLCQRQKPTELAHSFFILFLCLFLSLWPFQLYFIP